MTLRSLPSSCHYDNDPAGASAAPVYSTIRPRAKPVNSTTPVYDTAKPTNPRLGEGPPSLGHNGEYGLMPGKKEKGGRMAVEVIQISK